MSRSTRDFNSLKRELLEKRQLFVDTDFPANNRSLLFNTVLPGDLPAKKVEWKRPAVSRCVGILRPFDTFQVTAGAVS